MRKDSTPKKAPTKAQQRARLARDLSAVLSNPECPPVLYNDIGEAPCDMSSDIDYHTPEMVERTINAHIAREEKRKGGTR